MQVAGDALKSNLTTLGPIVLPWSEQIKFFMNLVLVRIFIRISIISIVNVIFIVHFIL